MSHSCPHRATTFRNGIAYCLECESPLGRRICPGCDGVGTVEDVAAPESCAPMQPCPTCDGSSFVEMDPGVIEPMAALERERDALRIELAAARAANARLRRQLDQAGRRAADAPAPGAALGA